MNKGRKTIAARCCCYCLVQLAVKAARSGGLVYTSGIRPEGGRCRLGGPMARTPKLTGSRREVCASSLPGLFAVPCCWALARAIRPGSVPFQLGLLRQMAPQFVAYDLRPVSLRPTLGCPCIFYSMWLYVVVGGTVVGRRQ